MNVLERILEDPVRFVRLKRGFYAFLIVLAATEALAPWVLYHEEGHFWFEDLPAWGSIYGFFSCAAIIIVSKLIGKLWLMRSENYYDS